MWLIDINGKPGRLRFSPNRLVRLETQKFRLTRFNFFFIILFNTGKEVIQKHMSLNHSEVAET